MNNCPCCNSTRYENGYCKRCEYRNEKDYLDKKFEKKRAHFQYPRMYYRNPLGVKNRSKTLKFKIRSDYNKSPLIGDKC